MSLQNAFDWLEEEEYGQTQDFAVDSTFEGPDLRPEDYRNFEFNPQPEHIPNYEQLSPYEKGVMDALPGLQDNYLTNALSWVSDKPVFKQVGQVIGAVFDVAQSMSEWAEQAIGTAYLMNHDPELHDIALGDDIPVIGGIFDAIKAGLVGGLSQGEWIHDPVARSKFQSAWAASASFYEVTGVTGPIVGAARISGEAVKTLLWDLPLSMVDQFFWAKDGDDVKVAEVLLERPRELVFGEHGWKNRVEQEWEHMGKVLAGDKIGDSFGLPQLIEMRKDIMAGNDPEEVKNAWLGDLGALAFRAQVWDAAGQALIDPFFFILPKIRIVDRTRFLRNTVRTSRLAPEIADAVGTARTLIGTAEDVQDAEQVFTKLTGIADELGFDEFATLVNEARAEVAVRAGLVTADELVGIMKPLEDFVGQFDHLKDMNKWERFLIAASGGDPLNPPSIQAAARGVPVVGRPLAGVVKMVTLTPKARASEFIHTTMTSIKTVLKATDDPTVWVKSLLKASQGAFGPELGHMMVSPIGRHVQAVVKGWAHKADQLITTWKMIEPERITLSNMATILKTDIVKILNRVHEEGLKGAEVLLREIAEVAARGGDEVLDPQLALFMDEVAAGRYTAPDLMQLGENLRSTPKNIVPYTPGLFRAKMVEDLVETAGAMAVAQFGVEAEGWIQKLTNPIKAMESALLLGLNYNYPIQNFFNNEITMIARGLFNTLDDAAITKIWDDFGMISNRLTEAFTIAGEPGPTFKGLGLGSQEELAALARADELLFEATRGSGKGISDRLTRFISDASRKNPADFRALAVRAERWQGSRAITQGLVKAWDKIAPHIIPHYDEVIKGLGERVDNVMGQGFSQVLRERLMDARKVEDIDAIVRSKNLGMNMQTIMRKTADSLGIEPERLKHFVSDEVAESVRLILKEVDPGDPAAMEKAFDAIRTNVEKGLDDALEMHVRGMTEEFAMKAQSMGPNGVLDIHGQVIDDIFKRQVDHEKMLDEGWELVNRIEDTKLKNVAVKGLMSRSRRAWRRTWNYTEAAFKGMEDGLRKGGFTVPDEFVGGAQRLRGTAEDYIKFRDKTWSDFFKEVIEGKFKSPASQKAAVQRNYTKLNQAYQKLINDHSTAWANMDTMFLRMFDDSDTTRLAAAWRADLRGMRKADMQSMLDFRRWLQRQENLSDVQKSKEWRKFNQNTRLKALKQIQETEQQGRLMLAGNKKARAYWTQRAGVNKATVTDESAKLAARMQERVKTGEMPGDLADPFDEFGRPNWEQVERMFGRDAGRINIPDERLDEVVEIPYTYSSDIPGFAGSEAVDDVTEISLREMQEILEKGPDSAVARGLTGGDVAGQSWEPPPGFQVADYDEVVEVLNKAEGPSEMNINDALNRWDDMLKSSARLGEEGAHDAALVEAELDALREALEQRGFTLGRRTLSVGEENKIRAEFDALENFAREQGFAQDVKHPFKDFFGPESEVPQEIQDIFSEHAHRVWSEIGGGGRLSRQDSKITDPDWIGRGYQVTGTLPGKPKGAPLTQGDQIWANIEKLRLNPKWLGEEGKVISGQHAIGRVLDVIASGKIPDELKNKAIYNRLMDTIMGYTKRNNVDPEMWAFLMGDDGSDLLRARIAAGEGLGGRPMDKLDIVDATGDVAAGGRVPGATLPSVDPLVERQLYQSIGIDELWFQDGATIVDEMQRVAMETANQPGASFAALPDDVKGDLDKYLNVARGQLNDSRHLAVRLAESYRDSAMLNYRRQYGFDAALGVFAPFGFWTTHSIARWAIHSLDYPYAVATWAKSREFFENVIGDRQNLPRRLRGRIKIDLPFVPEGYGEAWVDPMRAMGLPFGQFISPFESMFERSSNLDGQVENKLQEWLTTGKISEDEYDKAIRDPQSELATRARAEAQAEDSSLSANAMDFMNMAIGPHLPIQYAWHIMNGTTDEIGPLPHTRTIKNFLGLVGAPPSYYDNTFGNIRRAVGLPGFDQWEDYRIDRELSNMVAEGKITSEEAFRAMIEREGEVFEQAWRRTDKAQGFNSFMRMTGLPLQPYPEGEEIQRDLYSEFSTATSLRDASGSPEPVRRFFEQHPEFESRLALWDEPDVRLKKFLVDQMWDKYNDLSSIDRKLLREQLGDDFEKGFLDKETADPRNLPPDMLAMWLKQMGGDPPGTLGDDAIPIEFAPPDVARTAQQFYDARNAYFPDYFDLQNQYYDLAEGKPRWEFIDANPQLKAYWDWRRDFLKSNPRAAPFLSENFEPNYASAEAAAEARAGEPTFGFREAQVAMLNVGGLPLVEMASEYAATGTMSAVAREAFMATAENMGITLTEFLSILRSAFVVQ